MNDRCITCGDHAVPMEVGEVQADDLALCADETGAQEWVDTALVAPVGPGERLLVHAGVALARLP